MTDRKFSGLGPKKSPRSCGNRIRTCPIEEVPLLPGPMVIYRDTPFAMDAARLRMSQYDEFIRRCSRARIATRNPSFARALHRVALELRALNHIMGHILADRHHPTLLALVPLKQTGLVVLRMATS